MKQFCISVIILVSFLLSSCSENHQAAEQHLANARNYLAQQEFSKAKSQIDSVNILYPRSFDQRKASIPLLDSIRRGENNFVINNVNEKLAELEPKLEKMKADFVFQKDEKYQEAGDYNPKTIYNQGIYYQTTLHSGVEEDGRVYLRSIYLGSQKHNQLKIMSGDTFAETLVAEGDGFIHRFTDLGKTYEVIKFVGADENKVAQFIAENVKYTLKVQLNGQHTTSYILPQSMKEAVKKSFDLSSQMLLIDSLKTVKEQAEFKNFYLDNDKQLEIPIQEE